MGLCSSAENISPEEKEKRRLESIRAKELDGKMQKEHSQDQQINKLLLLGAGESGKSTLFKQMIQIYGKGFPEAERKTYVPIIANNVIASIKTLAIQCSTWSDNVQVEGSLQSVKQYVENELKGDEEIDEKLGNELSRLWRDAAVQRTFENRAHYQLNDSTKYFLDKVMEISKPGYLPSEQDVLRSRVRTTGIVENEFIIDGNQFKMFDVGGQRNERKKWIHCFENVTAVLFVGAISEYDQVLYEDENMNRVVEALNLFEEICNSRWFRETSMILFLNKRDLFAEKIRQVPLVDYFPEYQGGDDEGEGYRFMQDQFETRNRNPEKQIYTHITCATDTGNIAAVFNAVKDIIIRKSLNEAGLV